MEPRFSLIVAKSRNGVIGKDGAMPWHLSSDLKQFKRTTLGKPVLMGRVTWEGLPFPLPGRPNLVRSRDKNYKAQGAEVYNNLHEMIGRGYELAGASGGSEIILMGGAKLYALALKYVTRMYITEVDVMCEGDAHFPAIFAAEWTQVSEVSYPKGPKDDHEFAVKIFERR